MKAKPPAAEVIARQNALFDIHRKWMRGQDGAPFHPGDWPAGNSVYNQHYPDLEASAEALDDFFAKADELFKSASPKGGNRSFVNPLPPLPPLPPQR